MLELAAIVILGILAQWFAWRFRVPAILPLIITGLIVGPVSTLWTATGSKWIEPIYNGDTGLFPGESLFYFVSLAIGIILFEGGMTLKRKEIKGVGSALMRLIIIGAIGVTGGQYATTTAAAGQYNGYFLKTSGLNRWFIGKSNAAESGSDQGSAFIVWAYDDAGGQTLKPFTIYRNTGRVVLGIAGTSAGIDIGLNGPRITTGTGVPSHSAPDGSLHIRTDGGSGTTLYVRESGSWVGK